ncbi:hypothetical protein [Ktedonobacter sp. SOSP1-52]|nr:hypothetical protein [Ktedonobacter sp. SOSP1-52]
MLQGSAYPILLLDMLTPGLLVAWAKQQALICGVYLGMPRLWRSPGQLM